ncbi:AraC family transcriptional regulator [Noviherbaspirillum sp. Root189]|uniref:AraC family transcriptional regulator n=1 Tax=Noviherbaspirillum sp. Root189 TaxID=1736487 RepID=UPI00070A7AD6|nr:AraC family transcriptional regulator [Noviherbaspirillum sp. Root189]KRB93569.1 hypothetical protein ASE07_12810 [Noviherbaspirillum sp. Root189]
MDTLSEVLSPFKCTDQVLGTSKLNGNWAFVIEDILPGYCHVITEGTCWFEGENKQLVQLCAGDSILAVKGGEIRLTSVPGIPFSSWGKMWEGRRLPKFRKGNSIESPIKINFKQAGYSFGVNEATPSTSILTMAFCIHSESQTLIDALPARIVISASELNMRPWVEGILALLDERERHVDKEGFHAESGRLIEAYLLRLIRFHAATSDFSVLGLVQRVGDSRITNVLFAMNRNLAIDWSLDSLSSIAGMSRSAFAQKFCSMVGQTPFEYLTMLRMQLACHLLSKETIKMVEVAAKSGFQSERTFRDAFRRHHGMSPLEYRRSVILAHATAEVSHYS